MEEILKKIGGYAPFLVDTIQRYARNKNDEYYQDSGESCRDYSEICHNIDRMEAAEILSHEEYIAIVTALDEGGCEI